MYALMSLENLEMRAVVEEIRAAETNLPLLIRNRVWNSSNCSKPSSFYTLVRSGNNHSGFSQVKQLVALTAVETRTRMYSHLPKLRC